MMRFLRLVTTSIVMAFAIAACTVTAHAAPPVDGFIGVPWGASREQVEKIMQGKDFTLLEKRSDGAVDTYHGTFADYPAELKFQYEKNVFFRGSAAFLDVKDRDLMIIKMRFIEMKNLLSLKYGLPNQELIPYGSKEVTGCLWENIPTTVSPPGRISIYVYYGSKMVYGTGYLGNGMYMAPGLQVEYYIGSEWAKLKTLKDI